MLVDSKGTYKTDWLEPIAIVLCLIFGVIGVPALLIYGLYILTN